MSLRRVPTSNQRPTSPIPSKAVSINNSSAQVGNREGWDGGANLGVKNYVFIVGTALERSSHHKVDACIAMRAGKPEVVGVLSFQPLAVSACVPTQNLSTKASSTVAHMYANPPSPPRASTHGVVACKSSSSKRTQFVLCFPHARMTCTLWIIHCWGMPRAGWRGKSRCDHLGQAV